MPLFARLRMQTHCLPVGAPRRTAQTCVLSMAHVTFVSPCTLMARPSTAQPPALSGASLARAKVKFISESDAAGALDFIPPHVLPELFGGKAPLLPVDEAVRKYGLLEAPLRSAAKARRC